MQAFHAYTNGPISKVLTVDELLYNKVEIILHRHDEAGRAVQEEQKISHERMTVTADAQSWVIQNGVLEISHPSTSSGRTEAQTVDAMAAGRGAGATEQIGGEGTPESVRGEPVEPPTAKEAAAKFNEAIKLAETLTVQSGEHRYTRNNETGAIQLAVVIPAQAGIQQSKETITELGLGVLTVKAKVAKSGGAEILKVEVTLAPLKEKDSETTAYASNATANEKIIADFLAKWVKEPFERVAGGVKVGCEINFNKQFPKQSAVRSVKDLLDELHKLNAKGAAQEAAFTASIAGA